MIDISNEIAAIQAATTGPQIRSAIVSALMAINSDLPVMYSGSYSITPNAVGFYLPTSNRALASNLYIAPYSTSASLISQVFTDNGIYSASAYSANGFDTVVVSLPLEQIIASAIASYVSSAIGAYY